MIYKRCSPFRHFKISLFRFETFKFDEGFFGKTLFILEINL